MLIISLLLLVASAVAAAVKRVRLPYTVALVITGALLAVAARRAAGESTVLHGLLDQVTLTPGIVLYVLLPILIFEAAFNLDSRRLIKNLLPIVVLAVPAVIISTLVVGLILFFFGSVPHSQALVAAFLFGAMVSTTDAVAVVAIFRELGAPKRLTVLVEGEALFNSGTALVVFMVIASIFLSTEQLSAGQLLLSAVGNFVWMALGGIGVGVAIGFVFSRLIGLVEEDPLIEITLSTICAPLSFLIGGYMGVSDVMAVIGAGLTVGNYGRTKISPSSLEPLAHYWHYLAFVANSMIFLLVGFSLHAEKLAASAGVIGVAILAVLLARAVGIYPLVALVNRWLPQKIGLGYQTVMWWGGIRGALVLVMALSLSQWDDQIRTAVGGMGTAGWQEWVVFKDYVLHLAFGIVFFTILVQATSVKGVIGLFGLARYTPSERFEEKGSLLLAKRDVRDRLTRLRDAGVLSRELYALLVDRYMLWEGRLRKELADLRQGEGFTVDDERRTLLQHCLGGEKAHLKELFHRGDIGEDVMKELHIVLDNQLDRLRLGEEADADELAKLGSGTRLTERVLGLVARVLGTTRLAGWLQHRILDRQYEAARARLSAIEEVTRELAQFERAEGASLDTFSKLRDFYADQRRTVQERLESLAQVFPEYAAEVQEALSERYCLRSEEEVFHWLAARGRLSAKVLKDAVAGLREEMLRLRGRSRPEALINPADLVQRITFFTDLTREEVEGLAKLLLPIAFVEGAAVVRQGEGGDRMYLIARGSVEVVVKAGAGNGDPEERVLATLEAGDFFGEIALLSDSPRTATVRTRTACALLELRRRDLERVVEIFPHVRQVLEEAFRKRVLSTYLAKVPLFRDLSGEDRVLLGEAFHTERHAPGNTIERVGEVAESLWVVKSGQVTLGEGDGARTLREGEAFGVQTLCFPKAAAVEAKAQTEAEVVALRHFDFLALLEIHPRLREKVAPRAEEELGRELPKLPRTRVFPKSG